MKQGKFFKSYQTGTAPSIGAHLPHDSCDDGTRAAPKKNPKIMLERNSVRNVHRQPAKYKRISGAVAHGGRFEVKMPLHKKGRKSK